MKYQCDQKKAGNVEFRCYFQLAMMVIGGKWKPKVLFHLAQNGATRFGVLRRAVFGITEKMLIQSLKELEKRRPCKQKSIPPGAAQGRVFSHRSWGVFYSGAQCHVRMGKILRILLGRKGTTELRYQAGNVLENIEELVNIGAEQV